MELSEARERLEAMSKTQRLDAEEDYISAPGSTEAADAIDTVLAAYDAEKARADAYDLELIEARQEIRSLKESLDQAKGERDAMVESGNLKSLILDAATAEAKEQRERAEKAEGELAQALERWPGDGSPGDEIGMVNGKYCVIVPDVRLHESEVKRFTSRIDAARCAAGLPAKGAADAATPE